MPAQKTDLEVVVGQLLRGRGLTLAVAESCTGGLVGTRITDVPGSSAYYLGSVVAYASEVKERVLGVAGQTLRLHGAVSESTAIEMAQRVRHLMDADLGLSVTGIAGPGGPTGDKPVGLVYIGLVASGGQFVRRFIWDGDRRQNRAWSAEAALDLVRAYLEEDL